MYNVTPPSTPLSRSPWIAGRSPNAQRVAPVLRVSEEWGGWMLGTLVRRPDVIVELGFEHWQQFQPRRQTFPNTPIVYLALFSGRETLYEFQFGINLKLPGEDILPELHSLLQLFVGYTPFILAPRSYPPHELSVQSLYERQDNGERQPINHKRRYKAKAGMRRVRR